MHRSGTSALTRVINLLGAHISHELLPAVPGDNDRGYWESKAVVDIHDRLLLALGSSHYDPFVLPDRWYETAAALQAKLELAGEIKKDFSNSELFIVKDPRISRLLPLWLLLLDELQIKPVLVIPFRNPLEIVASLNKREPISSAQVLLLWVRSYLDVELASRRRRRIFVRYEQLLSDWRAVVRRLRKVIGPSLLLPNAAIADEINTFLTSTLYRNRSSREELTGVHEIASAIIEMFDRMGEAADIGNDVALRSSFDDVRNTVSEAGKLFEGVVVAEQHKHRIEAVRLKHNQEAAVTLLSGQIAAEKTRVQELEQGQQASEAKSAGLERELEVSSGIILQLKNELSESQNGAIELSRSLQLRSTELTQIMGKLKVVSDNAAASEFALRARSNELARTQIISWTPCVTKLPI